MGDAETKDNNTDEQVQLRFRIPTGMSSKLAQQMFVNNLGDVIQLSFFEIIPPPLQPNSPENNIAKIKEFGVTSECVARINIPASLYESFVIVMQQVLEREFKTERTETS